MTSNDDPSTDVHQELLTEHFGFHPRVFVDALVYAANEHLYSIGGQFEEFAKKQLKAACRRAAKKEKERGRAQISSGNGKAGSVGAEGSSALAKMSTTQIEAEAERGVHGVLTLMENALDHIFDLLELYCLKAVFGVRPSQATALTLRHHRGLDLRAAAERVNDKGEALTADAEYEALERYELDLRDRIESAKRRRHALRLANIAAERALMRAKRTTDAFSALTGDLDERTPSISSTTAQYARALRSDVQLLVQALKTLARTDPLGANLLTSGADGANDEERKAVMRASGVTEKEKRSWERGREAYINWEMDRIIRSVRTRAAGNETLLGDLTGMTSAVMGKDATKRLSRPSTGLALGAKRRRTTGRMSVATADEQENEEIHQAAQVGELQDVERMVALLSSSSSSSTK